MNHPSDCLTVPDYLRGGQYRHLAAVLDEEPPWILRKLIPLLSSRVRVEDHVVQEIRDLARMGPVIYAMKYRSLYDLHFLRVRFCRIGLPLPGFVLGRPLFVTGSLRKVFRIARNKFAVAFGKQPEGTLDEREVLQQVLEQGGAGVTFLVDDAGFRDRYVHPDRDPIRIILDLQGRVSGCISIVPLVVLYDRTPRRTIRPFWETFLGDPDRPGALRRLLIAFRRWTAPELLIGAPIPLLGCFEEFGAERSWEELPFELRKDLIESVNARIRVSRGPERLTKTEIKEQVLREPAVQETISELLSKEQNSPEKLRKKAESYVEEIAADPHLQIHHFLYYILKWTFKHVFDGIDTKPEQFELLKKVNEKGSLIFAPCHKSHMDYLLGCWLIFVNYMPVPYVAAGKNLFFWPVGPILRNGGAFSLRRSFVGLELYTQVFAAYIKVLLRQQSNVKFYMEGGRSRTGKLLPPRLGLLRFLLQAVDDGAVEDLKFVPSFVGYEQIPEESSYLRELSGAAKEKETLLSFLQVRKIFRRRYGRIYVRFHEPVSYQGFRNKLQALTGREAGHSAADAQLVEDFAYHLMYGIVRSGVATSVDLVSSALVCARKPRVTHGELQASIETFSRALRWFDIEFADSLDEPEKAIQAALGIFRLRGFIDIEPGNEAEQGPVYVIHENGRPNLQFYRNSLVNYLWSASLVAMILLEHESHASAFSPSMREEFFRLKRLFAREIIVDPLIPEDQILESTLELFREAGWSGEPSANNEPLRQLKGFLTDLLEAYELAFAALDELADGASQREVSKNMSRIAQERVSGDGAPPSRLFSGVAVRSALSRLDELGLVEFKRSRKVVKQPDKATECGAWHELLTRALGPNA
ncbi:MAG: 1-acyl-sn-glycerol-3-phosphate acyltransferase [Thermodesulfobacteriota bacterium]